MLVLFSLLLSARVRVLRFGDFRFKHRFDSWLGFLGLPYAVEGPCYHSRPDFCGIELEAPVHCLLHDAKSKRCVAFEGFDTMRRFYGCSVNVCSSCTENGMHIVKFLW